MRSRHRVPFADRHSAGALLGEALADVGLGADAIVFGLARGGVPVAVAAADRIGADVHPLVVRKLGVPGRSELAMGAIGPGGVRVVNEAVISQSGADRIQVELVIEAESAELARRAALYGASSLPVLAGRDVVLVDDGLATGASMAAAVEVARTGVPKTVTVAIPVAPVDAVRGLQRSADRVVCLATPEPFLAVGRWYENFSQTTDDEVRELLLGR